MLSRVVASVLSLGLIFTTMPVSAADFTMKSTVAGSVSMVGEAQLRGVYTADGTVFAGDSVRTLKGGFAKLTLSNGDRIQLAENTAIAVKNGTTVLLASNTGNVGFTASGKMPLHILADTYEIATDAGSGNVAWVGEGTLGVRSVKGNITVRNAKTRESYVLMQGQERLISVATGKSTPPLTQLASNLPGPIPQTSSTSSQGSTRTTTTTTTGSGVGMDAGAWLAVAGGAALGVVAIWALVYGKQARDDVRDIKNSINTQNTTLTNLNNQVAATQAALRAVQAATTAAGAAQAVQSNSAAIGAVSSQLDAAVNGSNLTAAQRAALTAQSATIRADAQTAAANAARIQGQIESVRGQLSAPNANVSALTTQLNTFIGQLNAEIARGNSALNAINNLINQARNMGVQNLPAPPTANPVAPPPTASASIPS